IQAEAGGCAWAFIIQHQPFLWRWLVPNEPAPLQPPEGLQLERRLPCQSGRRGNGKALRVHRDDTLDGLIRGQLESPLGIRSQQAAAKVGLQAPRQKRQGRALSQQADLRIRRPSAIRIDHCDFDLVRGPQDGIELHLTFFASDQARHAGSITVGLELDQKPPFLHIPGMIQEVLDRKPELAISELEPILTHRARREGGVRAEWVAEVRSATDNSKLTNWPARSRVRDSTG